MICTKRRAILFRSRISDGPILNDPLLYKNRGYTGFSLLDLAIMIESIASRQAEQAHSAIDANRR
jgi:hypothetical protein